MRTAAVLCALAASALAFTAPPASAQATGASVDEHPGVIETQENNCFETVDRRPVLHEDADAYVPDDYTVVEMPAPPQPAWLGDPNARVADVGFVDYVCESLSVNGHRPQPTIVSLGTVLVTGDVTPTTYYILWFGTDNPLLFARLRQLGVEAYFIPRSSYTETTNANRQRVITVDYVGAGPMGLNYSRTITVLTEPTGPTSQSRATYYHMGSKGEVSFTWENTHEPRGTANVCFELEPESLPTQYGITSFPNLCFPRPRLFVRGSWDGTIKLTD